MFLIFWKDLAVILWMGNILHFSDILSEYILHGFHGQWEGVILNNNHHILFHIMTCVVSNSYPSLTHRYLPSFHRWSTEVKD
jgi:hypothetical protein